MSDAAATRDAAPAGSPRFRPKRTEPAALPVEWPGRDAYTGLETRILGAFRDDLTEAEFDALALDIHAFQKAWNEPYSRWCAALPSATAWYEIPAVPQAMFKRYRLACFPPALPGRVFRTSGTTGETRGEHHLLDTRLYEAAVLAGWDRCAFPSHYQLALSADAADAPDSSLACMWRIVAARAAHHATFVRADGSLADAQLAHTLDCFTTRGQAAPVALLGTALGFLNFFERQPRLRLRLSPGSFVVETGGFKGSGRDIPKAELYRLFEERLGIPRDHAWNEYGMCELGSQFYTRGIGNMHRGGPWVRALVISPETGAEVAVGETGVLRIFDLANLGSVLAIDTADLAVRRKEGFELVGRDPGATARGCSRMADEAMRDTSGETKGRGAPGGVGGPPSQAGGLRHDTGARASALAAAATQFDFLGAITSDDIIGLVVAELGHADALDRFVPHAGHQARAIAPQVILHIFSGNTPAAALQSLIRGLLLGSHNLCKLPSAGLPEVAEFISALPPELAANVEVAPDLPDQWLACADAVIVFGDDTTIATIRGRCRPDQTFIPHGHRLSFGIFFDAPDDAALGAAARDACVFDQQGCLSPHVFFVREDGACTAEAVARRLADAMASFSKVSPRRAVSLTEANAIRSLRTEAAFRAANGEPLTVLASNNTDWTVIAGSPAAFPASPLNRTVFVKALPQDLAATLAPLRPHLSTCGIWPVTDGNAAAAAAVGVSRVCPIGKMQLPPLAWHHDGQQVLAPLVRWIDYER